MKKKGIFCFTLIIIIIMGLCAFYFVYKGKTENVEFGVSFASNYASVGDTLKIKISGAKKKDCEIKWYVNNTIIEGETGDSYTVTEDALEKQVMVRVVKDDETATATAYISKLPVFYFNTESGIGNDYTEGTLLVQGTEEFKDTDLYDGDVSIKLRGNSTRNRDKKPYKIELATKTDLLGLGKSKDWVLLAEDIDHTLVRNRLVMYFADALGLEYTSKATSVVLILNDKYQGVYTLIEHVRVGEDQVDITSYRELSEKLARKIVLENAVDTGVISKKEKNNADSNKDLLEKYDLLEEADELEESLYLDLSWLSSPYAVYYNRFTYDASQYVDIPDLDGGWLLEADFYSSDQDPNSVKTAFKQPFYFNTPARGYTNTELYNNAKKYIQTFEYALHSEDFTYHEDDEHLKAERGNYNFTKGWITSESETEYSDEEHDGYRYDDLFDMDSLVNYFLVCEFSRNWDSMKNSIFVYKDTGEKACIGPVWDYDWAFGNINMYNINTNYPTGWQTTDYYFSNEQLYQNYNWNRYLIKDEKFVQAVYDKYWEIRDTLIEDIIKDGGILDTWKEELQEAGEANDTKWSYTYKSYRSYGYDYSWADLEKFIDKRIAWFDEQFKDVDTLYESLNSYEQMEWK